MIATPDEGFLKARLIPIHGFRTNGSYLLLISLSCGNKRVFCYATGPARPFVSGLGAQVQIRSPRPIHARHPVLKFAAHLPLRGHSAIKLAAGDNPRTTTSIFAMPTRIGRRFSCARFRETGLLSYRFIRRLAYFISLGTKCLEPMPHPLGVITAALRSPATA